MDLDHQHWRKAGVRTLLSSEGRGWKDIQASFLHFAPARTVVPGASSHRLSVHFGRPVRAECISDGHVYRRVQSHGDIDIIPAGLEGSWEDDADCSIFRVYVTPTLVRQVAQELERDSSNTELVPQFQLHDSRLESLVWAIKAELESEEPSNSLYAESLGFALAVRLVEGLDRKSPRVVLKGQVLSPALRRRLVEYIETHLDQPLLLADIAAVAGLSVSHLKTLFTRSFGIPVHRYVMRRRVERAKFLLLSGVIPMSQAALEAGFSHQSHMARCMRKILGVSPGMLSKLQD